jgi:ADP-ribosylglycohydrolase
MISTAVIKGSGRDVTSPDYVERVYAGVLGKIIGVYLGRPFEGWQHRDILEKLGEIDHYVHEQLGAPLVVTDDDIAGTFSFLRALEDNGYDPNLTPAQIGQAWLNYLIEERTVLWWGGLGVSTEHTAYLRLKSGIAAPASGSLALNGKTISEQIGAQIFIDGWAMLTPGDPERAVDWARRAATVSHDGEALYGAQVIAAIEAQAFVEPDIDRLIDTALQHIPADSTITRLIGDVRDWHAKSDDWYATRALIEQHYGYDSYPGMCHMVPNHALIIMALLYGQGDLRRSLMIANTAGWDTDCNSGNVGAILGIRNGLAAFDETPDYRWPVADRLYLSTAEGGRGISDAVAETYRIVNAARALQGVEPESPKDGAKFHFSLPGSVQGFEAEEPDTAIVINRGSSSGQRKLDIMIGDYRGTTVTTPTFSDAEMKRMRGYKLFASPTLYPGQTVVANVEAAPVNAAPLDVQLVIHAYDKDDATFVRTSDAVSIPAGVGKTLTWTIPDLDGAPISRVGFQLKGAAGDSVAVDSLTWDGAPQVTLGRQYGEGDAWRRAWVDGVDIWEPRFTGDYHLTQNRGIGLIAQGTETWRDYSAVATIKIPLAKSAGIAVRIGGLRRYYAFVLASGGKAQMVKALGERTVLAETGFDWVADHEYQLEISISGSELRGSIDGSVILEVNDSKAGLRGGSAGFVIEEGNMVAGPITIMSA